MSRSNGRSKCDPCGIICLFFIYLIIIYTDYAFLRWIVLMSEPGIFSSLNMIVYQLILLLLAWSHLKSSTCDPGIVPTPRHGIDFSHEPLMPQQMMSNTHCWTICAKCQMYRPPRAHHCRVCKKCVRKMDHHCPWINNCVGELNQKYFIQFLCYVLLASLYTLVAIFITFMRVKNEDPNRIIHTIVLLIESLLFGLFSIAVLTDQISAVFNGETAVERVKSTRNVQSKPKMLLLREVCGHGPIYKWIFPCGSHDAKANKFNTHFVV